MSVIDLPHPAAAEAPSLRAFPRPGRLALRATVPGAEPAALVAAGREALRQLRAQVLASQPLNRPLGTSRRWLARLRGPAARDLASLALHAALVAAPVWQGGSMVVCLTLENAGGHSASLAWRRDGSSESLRWSCRGGHLLEDGACLGSAGVAAALNRPDPASRSLIG